MKIKIELNKNSSFNSENHFFECLKDLLEEWNNENLGLGCKEVEEQDAGFNSDRFLELKTFLEGGK